MGLSMHLLYNIICIAYCWTFEEKISTILSLVLNDFSLYSNVPPSDSMQAWVLGRISFTAVMI